MTNEYITFAKHSIQELAMRYSDALNRKDWKTFKDCWMWASTYEVRGASPSMKDGLDSIETEMKAVLSQTKLFFQITHPGVIEVLGREASARFPLTEVMHFPGNKGKSKNVRVVGFFEDKLKYGVDGYWHFEKRIYTVIDWSETFSELKSIEQAEKAAV